MTLSKNSKITLRFSDGTTEEFTLYCISRWLSLINAFEYINEYIQTNNIQTTIDDYIKKPTCLYEYINDKQPFIENALLSLNDDNYFKFDHV